MTIDLQRVSRGYDRKTCWVHARPGWIPGTPGEGIVTVQKLLLSGDDVFYEINTFHTKDGGRSWSGPVSHQNSLGRKIHPDGTEEALCDFTPKWHASSGVLLGTGLNAFYRGDRQLSYPDARRTCYSVYDPGTESWLPWQRLAYPTGVVPLIEGAGCTQRVDLANGEILLPTYRRVRGQDDPRGVCFASLVIRCRFDGRKLEYAGQGTELSLPTGRGLVEPSLMEWKGRYYLTMRNDEAGYVSVSGDGMTYSEPRRWTFDDGADLGNYNTQQHWVACGGDLYLVYTRRGAENDHVMRHRAPLFIAQVDGERLCILRGTEQVLVPERGARLGNFGVARVSATESWISVAEWMQTKPPNPFDCRICERYGSDNSLYVAKVSSR